MMVEERYEGLLTNILEILDTACQANFEMLARYRENDFTSVIRLVEDLCAVMETVRTAQEPMLPQLEHAYTAEMVENVESTLEDIQFSIQSGNIGRAGMKMEFQLLPFIRCLRGAFYFYGAVCPDQEKMRQYYEKDFAEVYQNMYVNADEEPVLRLSIVVTGYNHLETTKQCVQHLLKETDFEKLNAELILIDHGSTDGTLEYFEGLGVGKVIHFKKNARANMFATLFQICRGKYFSFVSNDILVTRNWADILLNCLESDEKIIIAVPATPNIVNYQTVGLPNLGPEEYVAWANQQNGSDPSRWNDRSRLMPPVAMYRTAAVNRIGFADPYLYSMEYWDDDFSFRARRAGYRQILCNDVTCYHFGSVTGKEGQAKEGTLVYGRELFFKKHGVDAWGSGFCYDYTAIHLFKQLSLPQQNDTSALGIDCGMGDTLLQIGNELRHLQRNCALYQITEQKEYWPDLSALFVNSFFTSNLAEDLKTAFGQTPFSVVWIGRDIGQYGEYQMLLAAISERLLPGGWLLFPCTNPFFAVTLSSLLQLSVPENRCVLLSPEYICQTAGRFFSYIQMLPIKQTVSGIEAFVKAHFATTKRKEQAQVIEKLSTSSYYFICRK